ncbi:MAG: AI-2E family transporter [Planctomycetaceae bacterium]|nr:AI-2E family transporter [Planctomycetaceae bacterium]
MARIVSFLVLVAILLVIAAVFLRVMAGFFVPLFLAALLGVIIQPLYRWILAHCRGYRYAASTLTTGLVLVLMLLPIGLVITTATMEGLSILDQLQLGNVRTKLDELRTQFGLHIPRKDDLQYIEARLKRWRNQLREGVSPDVSSEKVENLLRRVDEMATWLKEQGTGRAADHKVLRSALVDLRDAKPDTVEQDTALVLADAEFREFKRNLLGGTYRAFLTELANPTDEQLEQIRKTTLSTAGSVVSFGGDTLVMFGKLAFGMLIMVVSLFFLLAEGSRMLDAFVRLSPLEEHHVRELVAEFERACRAIVSATLLSAVVQGLLAGIGFYFVGLQSSVALLMLLTMVLALVPFAGAAAVWIPVCLYLYFYQGHTAAAVGLALYGGIIVSQSDNVIKPYVLHGQSNLHPLLALLSVLGGLQALGPIGILVGPMVVVFLQVLLKLVQREMSSLDKTTWFNWPGFAAFAQRTAARPPGSAESAEPASASSAASDSDAAALASPAAPPSPASTGDAFSDGNGRAEQGRPSSQQPRHGK